MEFRLVVEGAHRASESRLARRSHEASRERRLGVHSAAARSASARQSDVLTHDRSTWLMTWIRTCDWQTARRKRNLLSFVFDSHADTRRVVLPPPWHGS